jgi:undecaprenyl-diphosphatase
VLAWRAGRRWLAAALAAVILLVGISRVYLGAHWVSDVAGGYAIGALWLAAYLPLAERLLRRDRAIL